MLRVQPQDDLCPIGLDPTVVLRYRNNVGARQRIGQRTQLEDAVAWSTDPGCVRSNLVLTGYRPIGAVSDNQLATNRFYRGTMKIEQRAVVWKARNGGHNQRQR